LSNITEQAVLKEEYSTTRIVQNYLVIFITFLKVAFFSLIYIV
jgi:hypothetical protein